MIEKFLTAFQHPFNKVSSWLQPQTMQYRWRNENYSPDVNTTVQWIPVHRTIQSSLYAPLSCTTRQNKSLVSLRCWSTALTDRGSIQKSVRSKNPCYVLFFYWWFYGSRWDKVAGSHDKHSISIRGRLTFRKATGLRGLYKLKSAFI